MAATKPTPPHLIPLRRALLASASAAAIAIGAHMVDLSPVMEPTLGGK